MKAEQIQFGDELVVEGKVVYEVKDVREMPPHVVATVRFTEDGGWGERMWEAGTEVPLTRPL